MTALAIAIALGALLVAGLAATVFVLAGADPPPEPPDNYPADVGDRESLFRPPAWKKGQPTGPGAEAAAAFHRPLEVEVLPPEDGVLPPPREVRGVNGEN